jgi:hypothetical protein
MKKSIFIVAMMLFSIIGISNASMTSGSTSNAPLGAPMADCTITVKGTHNGKPVNYEITVHGISCAELVKQVVKK